MNTPNDMVKKSLVAQWAFDTRPILGRFHLWLEDVKVDWLRGEPETNSDVNGLISFVDERTERLLIMTAAVTALGTKLFGRYGEGKDLDKKGLNQVKKDADAISAYAMSESLWYLSRTIPENHAIMVCLGEGLMPKAGETKEMGANPLLGFGRIYARPQVAKFLDKCVQKLINNEDYVWENFRHDIINKGITVWGAAIDTLENTSRFAKGSSSGPMTVLNLFDQPLAVANQYEGYMGTLLLPNKITETAAKISLLVDFFTPREKIMEAIKLTYPGIAPENIHVWTLRGKNREPRIGKLWEQWKNLGVNLVEDDWEMPTGQKPFTDSGTYAPSFMVGTWKDKKDKENLFIVDGYAASAEAIQAASLYRVLNLSATLSIFSSQFKLSYDVEPRVMQLDPDAKDFALQLSEIFEKELDEKAVNQYRDDILHASDAEIPLHKRVLTMDNFIAEKKWSVMAISGYMLPDPYSGIPGVQQISDDTFEVTTRLSTRRGDKRVTFKLRLEETLEESQLVFQPLLNRFLKGEGFRDRPVKISDSGRIRNELQTLFSDALEHPGERKIVVYLDRIPPIIPQKHLGLLREILEWYKESHPTWFAWLEIV